VHNITKGNLKSIVATGNQGVLFSEALKYEINGNIKEQTVQNVSDSYKYTFDYDRINRLTSANSDVIFSTKSIIPVSTMKILFK